MVNGPGPGGRFGNTVTLVGSNVTTLQGRLVTRLSEVLGRSLGMTLSRLDLVFVWLCEKCSATQGDLFRCLITCLRV